MSRNKDMLAVSVDKGTIEKIDEKRGMISRSAYVQKIIDYALIHENDIFGDL